ncbi:MAG: hypothetical protein JNM27_07010 [Leptospirales bacterium]|nr:hypothetical protein [Leptospirales bacterium]
MFKLFTTTVLFIAVWSCRSNATETPLLCDFGRITKVNGSEIEFCGKSADFPAQSRVDVMIHGAARPGKPVTGRTHVKVGTAVVQAGETEKTLKATLTSGYARVDALVRREQ